MEPKVGEWLQFGDCRFAFLTKTHAFVLGESAVNLVDLKENDGYRPLLTCAVIPPCPAMMAHVIGG